MVFICTLCALHTYTVWHCTRRYAVFLRSISFLLSRVDLVRFMRFSHSFRHSNLQMYEWILADGTYARKERQALTTKQTLHSFNVYTYQWLHFIPREERKNKQEKKRFNISAAHTEPTECWTCMKEKKALLLRPQTQMRTHHTFNNEYINVIHTHYVVRCSLVVVAGETERNSKKNAWFVCESPYVAPMERSRVGSCKTTRFHTRKSCRLLNSSPCARYFDDISICARVCGYERRAHVCTIHASAPDDVVCICTFVVQLLVYRISMDKILCFYPIDSHINTEQRTDVWQRCM